MEVREAKTLARLRAGAWVLVPGLTLAALAGHSLAQSSATLPADAQRSLETVQRAYDAKRGRAPAPAPAAPAAAPAAAKPAGGDAALVAKPAPQMAGASSMLETQRVMPSEPLVKRRATPATVEYATRRNLVVGEISTINIANVARIAIGDGAVVKASVVDDAQIVLIAERAGTTSMHVWLKNGRQIAYEVAVTPENNSRLVEDLKAWVQSMPGIRVTRVGEKIALEGRYPNNEAKARIKGITDHFPQIMNLVAQNAADADPLQMERTVLLDMRVIEVKRSSLEQLGIKWAESINGPTFATNALLYSNTPFRPGSINSFAPVNTAHPFAAYLGFATQLTSALNILEQKGDAWTLAEPRLSCKSGGEASFNAGGEIPIPVSAGLGVIEIVYKQYGVTLKFKPVADGQGNVSAAISIEVTEPDARNSAAGYTAFTKSAAETQVALKSGEPMIIAGLLREKVEKSADGLPVLNRLPLMQYIFGSRENRTEKTELVIVATPRVITPTSGQTSLAQQQIDEQIEVLRQQRDALALKPIRQDTTEPASAPAAPAMTAPAPAPATAPAATAPVSVAPLTPAPLAAAPAPASAPAEQPVAATAAEATAAAQPVSASASTDQPTTR